MVAFRKLGNQAGIELKKAFDFGGKNLFLVVHHLVVAKAKIKSKNL